MKRLFEVRQMDDKVLFKTLPLDPRRFFESKPEAKALVAEGAKNGLSLVITRGPDHKRFKGRR